MSGSCACDETKGEACGWCLPSADMAHHQVVGDTPPVPTLLLYGDHREAYMEFRRAAKELREAGDAMRKAQERYKAALERHSEAACKDEQ